MFVFTDFPKDFHVVRKVFGNLCEKQIKKHNICFMPECVVSNEPKEIKGRNAL